MGTVKVTRRRRVRRAAAASSPLGDQPWWVRAVVWVGMPTAVAAVLLWFLMGQFKELSAEMKQHTADTASLVQHLQMDSEQGWVTIGTLQRICLNTAKTDADRLACVALTPRPK